MKPKPLPFATAFLSATLINSPAQTVAGDTQLTIRHSVPGLELSWPATFQDSDGSIVRPYFELQRSADLLRWQPIGERQRAAAASPALLLGITLGQNEPHAFYRLLGIQPNKIAKLGSGGAEVFGYGDAFADELQRIGQISPDEFAAMFPSGADYLPNISWDPTTASYWEQFNADPRQVNEGKTLGQPGFRTFDARLNDDELAIFKKNGFVASERLGSPSFGHSLYTIWHNDLPVFISCDALLQAWHRTYDAMLQEVEETYLFNSLQSMLDGMAAQMTLASAEAGDGALKESLQDADWFLTVARSLLAGSPVTSELQQQTRVAATWEQIWLEQLLQVDDFMGFCRVVDFSQFRVRGHYTASERLGRYFKCMMWLGRIDVPVAGGPWELCPGELHSASVRELGMATVLWRLIHASGQFDNWREIERTIQVFVGPSDSMTFGQLGGLLAGAGIQTLADLRDVRTLEKIQSDIISGDLGIQSIRSDWFEKPLGGEARYALPRAFTVFGQKFVPDSWAFSQTVFENILWVENSMTRKVQRRVPSALDVAFSVLGNNQIVPELVAQMTGTFQDEFRPHALKFRDGLPYQHNLAAVRGVMDLQTPSSWDANLYMSWLDCLRELSAPTTGLEYPEAMRTRAWGMKTLNTQLASWTQLRHDTILYARQSYTSTGVCVYPTGFVEPRVEFWKRLSAMASRAAEQIAGLRNTGDYPLVTLDFLGNPQTNFVALATIQARQVNHLQNFAGIITRLELLATKELNHECFSNEDEQFIDGMMESSLGGAFCRVIMTFSGWYPHLFYQAINQSYSEFNLAFGAGAFDAVVADVHTDVPCHPCNDPGSVLHEATGRANLLILAVDNGPDRFICAGPVLSHYELEVMGDPRRLSDEEWGGSVVYQTDGILQKTFPGDVPPSRMEGLTPPTWTRSYLVRKP